VSGRDQRLAVTLALAWLGCGDASGTTGGGSSETSSSGTASETTLAPTSSETSSETSGTSETGELPESVERAVEVRLDGAPLPDAIVIQGGTGKFVLTDQDGRAQVDVDLTIPGDITLIASHELARSKAQTVDPYVDAPMVFELSTIAAGDNEQYVFNPPGEPGIEGTTLECGHCHAQLKAQWYDSPHRRSASNPIVHDIYAGTAANFADPSACTDAGGDWWIGKQPGSDQLAPRCYLGVGALPDLNPQCGQDQACDQLADTFGACADCHAPAIDGVLGGRDLLEAIGTSYEAGVHCDLCHKVESVDLAAPAGVGGRLHVHRPLEPTMSPGLGPWQPLAFGPYADVPNPRMGASPRELFMQAEFCAGCHQHDQAALVPGDTLDPTRWPDALLPVHSTYEEWRAGPLFAVAPCSSCHMPADPQAGNGADLLAEDIHLQGVARGWWRPPGAVRQHVWVGPRTPESGMLQLAAAIFIDKEIAGQSLIATVTVRNAGAGHAIPTGEPLRSLVLLVRARCGGQSLVATGGDAVPEFAGWLDRKLAPEDWSIWPGASVGDVVRVVADDGFVDYAGFGPFGDGTFDVAQKGLAKLRVVGQATITAVNGDVVTFDAPLPVGDIAYRGRPDPFEGDPQLAEPLAGAPGFAFARVLADASGNTMVPHHRAVDIVSDNRILPQTQWSSTHEFALACADPVVDALLVHRAYPVELARERGWAPVQQIMVEVSE
jgi:hypothetical protein